MIRNDNDQAANSTAYKYIDPCMSYYAPRFSENADGSVYALIVRVDPDGSENVIHGYAGRHFANQKNAVRSTTKHIEAITKN